MYKQQNELIKMLSDKQIISQLYLTQMLLLTLAIILSMILVDGIEEFFQIWRLNDLTFLTYGSIIAIIVIGFDFLIMKFVPKEFYDDGGINERIFEKRSIIHIVFLTALIAATEEFLFRGVLQTHFGLWIASIIFALLHFRYLTKWLLFTMVVAVSFLLGIFYEWTDSLYTTIFAHFIIDLVFALQIRFQYLKRGGI
ncbi:lysostaphin resistance A-like protein [Metabacillus herbersteinensis]|uniref:Lysostaphin resistance A-like protein n=1 Tax=Metabacillus herbersteinensis TaxID=283816 RepID=A0ABV6GD21_9BACI